MDDFVEQIFKKTSPEQMTITSSGFENKTLEKEETIKQNLPSWLTKKK